MAGLPSGSLRRQGSSRRDQSGAVLRRVVIFLAALALALAGVVVVAGAVPTFDASVVNHQDLRGAAIPVQPALRIQPPATAPTVLSALGSEPPLSIARLRVEMEEPLADPSLGRRLGFAVAQLGGSGAGWSQGPSALIPASTLKLLTTTAALAVLGPAHRFTTSVVEGSSQGTIVLVGGGDPLLVATPSVAAGSYPVPATLAGLARAVAAQLADQGLRRVRLGYDTSLFSGPAVNPDWPASYIPEDVVSPISPLWVNEGRLTAGLASRAADPAKSAAEVFANLLAKAGVRVVGPVVEQAAPPAPQTRLASMDSAPLDQIVQHILEVSDNEGAEVLLRQVAVGLGRPGSSQAGVAAVRTALTGLGLDLDGAVIYDGSGLSRDNRVSADLLLQVLETAASEAHPALRGVIDALPVAGFTGSLGDHFVDDARVGRGYVRAKTGTLTEVRALAGIAVTRTGQVLIFAVLADRVRAPRTLDGSDLDWIAAALSACRC